MRHSQHPVPAGRRRLIPMLLASTVGVLAVSGAVVFGLGNANAATATAAVTGTGGAQINSGGAALYPLAADMDFSGGSTSSTNASVAPKASANPIPQFGYTTNRYGNFRYVVPALTPGASYAVR